MDDLDLSCSVSNSVFNISDTNNVFNISDTHNVGNETTKAMNFGTATGIIIAFIMNVVLNLKIFAKKSSLIMEQFDKKIILRAVVLLILVLMVPIIIVSIIFALCYKFLCSIIIKRKDENFVTFLDSFDVFWYLEGDSVINILGTIESKSPEALVKNIKHKLLNLYKNKTSDKIFYRRNEEYGFYYWKKNNFLDMNEYIEILDLSDKFEVSEADLEDIMADLSRQPLPYDDEGLFKIIITKQRMTNQDNDREEYGIIFRIHHSVGDGVALIKFLCESLADKEHSFSNSFSMSEFRNKETPDDILKMIRKLCEIPMCIVDLILRKPDENTLHGPTTQGIKYFKWTKSDEDLLIMVKEIKDNITLNFSDVIAMALAGGLKHYFYKTKAHAPEDVAVIVPIRFPPPPPTKKDRNILNNDFTVAMFDLPVNEHRNLNKMKSRFADFRLNKEYLANYYILKLASIFPKPILKPIFFSSQATVTLSNMPGPDVLSICGGTLRKLIFFLPLKGTTGVGVSAFCYGGVLRLALSADAAVVLRANDLGFILEGMVDEIKQMHALYVKK